VISTVARARARLSLAWLSYGSHVSPSVGLKHAVGHAARGRMSARLLSAHLTHVLRRPRSTSLPAELRAMLDLVGPSQPASTTWLVHVRPQAARTIVHEIDGAGSLLSVVKIGRSEDEKLQRERRVLEHLAGEQPEGRSHVLVPRLVAAADDGVACVLRTRLDLGGLVAPPYHWHEPTLELADSALATLHRMLASVDGARTLQPAAAGISQMSPARQLVTSHGDFTAWNLFLVGEGADARFAVIDFEDCGIEPSSWDAARLLTTLWSEGRVRARHASRAAAALRLTRAELAHYVTTKLGQPGAASDKHEVRDLLAAAKHLN
jgi:hypothetical protein